LESIVFEVMHDKYLPLALVRFNLSSFRTAVVEGINKEVYV